MNSIFKREITGDVSKSKGFFDFIRDKNGKIQPTSIIKRTITDEELMKLEELPSDDSSSLE